MQGFVRNGITLLSEHDPVRRCNRITDAVNIRERTLYFCPSPLFGYGLERLIERIVNEAPDSAVLCVEADSELYELSLKNINASVFSNKMFRITNCLDIEGLYSLITETWGARAFRRIEIVKFTGGWQLFNGLYNALADALRREFAIDWSNALTLSKLGRLYIRNVIRNLLLIKDFIPINEFSFGESPVLVLGAGPSLDDVIDGLEKHFPETCRLPQKRTFRIICVDTCLGALKEREITPDLVVILESQHWNLRDFIGCKDWNVKAAVDFSALPQSAKILNSAGYLFFTPWTRLRIFERLKSSNLLPPVVPPLGSVGNSAVEIARRVSGGKIICAGLDFSFSVDKYHALGTPGHLFVINSQNRFRRILNSSALDDTSFAAVSKSGGIVRSSPIMRNYRDLFENEFGDDKRLYDITGSGLPLGLKTLYMEEALAILGEGLPVNESEIKHDVCKKPKTTLVLKSFIQNEKKRLDELKNILTGETPSEHEHLATLIEECDYLWAHFPDYSGGSAVKKIDNLRTEIEKGGEKMLSFLKRVRVEIDPMIELFNQTEKETG